MSNSNGTSYTARSMNGIITIDDGAGTVIEDGIITTNGLKTNNILAEYVNQACSIFSNITSGIIQIGSSTVSSIINLGRYITISDSTIDSSLAINIGAVASSGINLGRGSGYVRSLSIAISDYDMVNFLCDDYLCIK